MNKYSGLLVKKYRNKFKVTESLLNQEKTFVMLNLIQHLKNIRFRNEFGMTCCEICYPEQAPVPQNTKIPHQVRNDKKMLCGFKEPTCHPELVSGSEFKSSKKSKKLAAFTLAEVLITLAIIGIVAAMTIPTLVSNIQEHQFHAKWKECYSILNSAFNMTTAENPRMIVRGGADNTFPSNDFINAFLSHLYVIDTCGYSVVYDAKLCQAASNSTYWVGITNIYSRYKTLAGGNLNAYDFCKKAALLRNGAAIYFGSGHSGMTILVDVNNYSVGPNILGKDVYAISVSNSSNTYNVDDLDFKPYGAEGTRVTMFNYQGCSPDIGAPANSDGNINYLYQAPGAGCSLKYLHEK